VPEVLSVGQRTTNRTLKKGGAEIPQIKRSRRTKIKLGTERFGKSFHRGGFTIAKGNRAMIWKGIWGANGCVCRVWGGIGRREKTLNCRLGRKESFLRVSAE